MVHLYPPKLPLFLNVSPVMRRGSYDNLELLTSLLDISLSRFNIHCIACIAPTDFYTDRYLCNEICIQTKKCHSAINTKESRSERHHSFALKQDLNKSLWREGRGRRMEKGISFILYLSRLSSSSSLALAL